jgi:hypothetical protein
MFRTSAICLVVGCGAEPGETDPGDPPPNACAEVVGLQGDTCDLRFADGPPGTGMSTLGTPSLGVGVDPELCTCVEENLEDACLRLNFEGGCPTLTEAYEFGSPGRLWVRWAICLDVDGHEWDVAHVPDADAGYLGGSGQEFLYFPLDGDQLLAAVSLDADSYLSYWCCSGTYASQRWIGTPIALSECELFYQECD